MKSSEVIIYIDPYFWPEMFVNWIKKKPFPIDPNKIQKVDAVVSTHEHIDHCEELTITPLIRNTKAPIIGPSSSIELVRRWGTPDSRVIEMKPFEFIWTGDIKVTALPSKDINAKASLTFLFQKSGKNIFHGGDCNYIPQFHEIGSKWDIDIALLSTGWGNKRMDLNDLVRAAKELKAKTIIPTHWNLPWRDDSVDPYPIETLVKEEHLEADVKFLMLGDRLSL
jgi:L-ascorbate metabolism protein UlaG (beta-lactamase superfamily)